ncbi:MAG: hypothetical protein K2W96_19125 [Gemmataceae bacterium]|nr:hypothetical protein [Gemmataceae bacterium]
MADKSSQLVIAALARAAADPLGVPLFAAKGAPGLFPSTAAGKLAAQKARDEGHLQAGDDARCTITGRGLEHLLGQVSPRQVLEDFVRVLESRSAEVARMAASLDALRSMLRPVLDRAAATDLKSVFRQFHDASPDPCPVLAELLAQWNGTDDCPLPDLYRRACDKLPALSVGQFHDALRLMEREGLCRCAVGSLMAALLPSRTRQA